MILINSVSQLFQMGRRNINLLFSELDLNESPSSIMQANDRVRFQSRLIPIMEHISAKRISIHTQVANTHGLKQQAKGLEIIKEFLRGRVQYRQAIDGSLKCLVGLVLTAVLERNDMN